MTDLVLSAEPASYVTALTCISGRIIAKAVDRYYVPKVCQDTAEVEAWVRAKHPLPCLVVYEDSRSLTPVRHVLVR